MAERHMVHPASINFILNDVVDTVAFPVWPVQVEAPRSNQHGEARTEIPYMKSESGTTVDLGVLAIATLRNDAGQSFPEQLPRVWTTLDGKADRAPAGGATHQLEGFQPPSWSIASSLTAGGNGCSWPTLTVDAHGCTRTAVSAHSQGVQHNTHTTPSRRTASGRPYARARRKHIGGDAVRRVSSTTKTAALQQSTIHPLMQKLLQMENPSKVNLMSAFRYNEVRGRRGARGGGAASAATR
jgi:hypothetical protein